MQKNSAMKSPTKKILRAVVAILAAAAAIAILSQCSKKSTSTGTVSVSLQKVS